MNLKTFAKAVRRSAGKNASKILGGLAITGSITAVYFAVTATPKAMILLDEKKQELGVEKLDVKTIVKTAGPGVRADCAEHGAVCGLRHWCSSCGRAAECCTGRGVHPF